MSRAPGSISVTDFIRDLRRPLEDPIDELIETLHLRSDSDPPPRSKKKAAGLVDPLWKLPSVSLRQVPGGEPTLYLKMPTPKLWDIIMSITYARNLMVGDELGTLPFLHDFLRAEHSQAKGVCVFLGLIAEVAERDILALEAAQVHAPNGTIDAFIHLLRAGLRNDPAFDWITRCGGPAYNVSDNDTSSSRSGERNFGLPG